MYMEICVQARKYEGELVEELLASGLDKMHSRVLLHCKLCGSCYIITVLHTKPGARGGAVG
jgi:hypothetical protein